MARPLYGLSLHFFHHPTLLPSTPSFKNAHIHFHYSVHPFCSQHRHSSKNSFPQPKVFRHVTLIPGLLISSTSLLFNITLEFFFHIQFSYKIHNFTFPLTNHHFTLVDIYTVRFLPICTLQKTLTNFVNLFNFLQCALCHQQTKLVIFFYKKFFFYLI